MKKNLIKIAVVFSFTWLHAHAITEKPYHELSVNKLRLDSYPNKQKKYPSGTIITIGDLHGNAHKLIYFLIQNNVLQISSKDYQEFIKIYNKPPKLLKKRDIQSFHKILDNSIINQAYKLRFLGDDLCDRGMNDYYTLNIFKLLDMENIDFEITLSNHNSFFIEAYEQPEQSFSFNRYGEGRHEDLVRSMLNLGKIIDSGLVNKQDVIDTVQNNYLKHLVLPGVTVNKKHQEVTLYSHAPFDLKVLKSLADDLDMDFKDANLKDFSASIQEVSSIINTWIMSNTFTENYLSLNSNKKLNPLYQMLWNRNYSILNQTNKVPNRSYTVNYVHGHDSKPNVMNLDTKFGKGDESNYEHYAVYFTSDSK